MIVTASSSCRRPGITLLEVLVSLAIFLVSLAVLSQLVSASADKSNQVRLQSRAAQLCRSKLGEVVSGVQQLSSESGSFGEDPDWSWTVDSEPGDIPNLWNVTVTVKRDIGGGTPVEFALNQMVLDPSARGSTFDTPAASTSTDTSGSSSSGSPGASGSTGATTPSATPSPSSGGMTRPSTSTPSPGAGGARPSTTTPSPGGSSRPAPGGATPSPSGGSPGSKTGP
jgi:general secretion pathway protein I